MNVLDAWHDLLGRRDVAGLDRICPLQAIKLIHQKMAALLQKYGS